MSAVVGIKGFQEGESGNPNGRPKGAYSPLRKQLLELRKRAANDIEEAYTELWKDFINGDATAKQLARQIYFKELVSIPKEWMNETIIVANKEGISRLEALTQSLSQITELTHEEALNEVKVLKSIEQQDELAKPKENIFERLTDAQGRQLHLWLTEVDK